MAPYLAVMLYRMGYFDEGYSVGHLHALTGFIPELPQPLPFQSLRPVTRRTLLPKSQQPLYYLGVRHVRFWCIGEDGHSIDEGAEIMRP